MMGESGYELWSDWGALFYSGLNSVLMGRVWG